MSFANSIQPYTIVPLFGYAALVLTKTNKNRVRVDPWCNIMTTGKCSEFPLPSSPVSWLHRRCP
uniref:Putative ovule protein n=1 Tax=Solanum chacoense TaxID=4108 RepID=A0A0V0GRY2_SOLCH